MEVDTSVAICLFLFLPFGLQGRNHRKDRLDLGLTEIFRYSNPAGNQGTHCLGMSYYVNFLGGLGSSEFHII